MSFDMSQAVDFVTTYSQHIDWVSTGELGGGAVVVIGLLAILAKKAKKKKKGDESTVTSESFHQTTLDRADTEDIKNEFDNITMQTQEFDAGSEFTADGGKKHELSVVPTLSPTDEEEHLLNSAFNAPETNITRSHQLLDEALVLDSYGRKNQALEVLSQAIEATTNSREKLRLKVIAQSYQDKPYSPDLLMNLTENMPSFIDREGNPVTSLKDVRSTISVKSDLAETTNSEVASALPFVAAEEESSFVSHRESVALPVESEKHFDLFAQHDEEVTPVALSVAEPEPVVQSEEHHDEALVPHTNELVDSDSFLHKPAVRNLWDRVQEEEKMVQVETVKDVVETTPVKPQLDDSFDFDFTTKQVSDAVETHSQHQPEEVQAHQPDTSDNTNTHTHELSHSIFENQHPVSHDTTPLPFKLADDSFSLSEEPVHNHSDLHTEQTEEPVHHEAQANTDEDFIDTSLAGGWALMQQEQNHETHHEPEIVKSEDKTEVHEQFKLFPELQETTPEPAVTSHAKENSSELLQAILAQHPEHTEKEKEPEQLNLFSGFDMSSWDQNTHSENQPEVTKANEDEAEHSDAVHFEHAQQWDNHQGFELVKENKEENHEHSSQGNEPVHQEPVIEEYVVSAEQQQTQEQEEHAAPEVSHMVDQTISKLIQEAEAHELVGPDTLEEEQQSNRQFWEAFGDMANDLNKEMPTRTETLLNGPSKLNSPPERDTIWVNWMAQIEGKASLRNNFIELEHAWGTRSAVEELHRFLTHYAGRDDDNLPNSWAVLSVYVIR
jgi:hypothetical protein